MNREEINKLISDYESKWGKLGAGNSILNPEKTAISHSGLNNSNDFYGGKRKMLNMTNDYYEFRRKVAEGKNKNKLAHAATVNIDEINRQYWEKINTDGTLIHTSGRYVPDYEEDDDYLEHAGNVKYYQKIELPSGKTRYFYTKEEWDAYQNKKNPREEAMKKAQKKQHQLNTAHDMANNIAGAVKNALNTASTLNARQEAKKNMNLQDERWKNMQGDTVKQYAQIARESTPAAAAKEFMKEDAVTEFLDTVEEGFKSGKLRYENGYLVADDERIGRNLDSTTANINKWTNWIGKESGNGGKIQDELDKLIGNDIEKLYNKYNRKTESNGKKLVQHSAYDDDIDTGVMSEYRAFKARADRGAEMNRLSHSSFISPNELNERYEEEIASHCFLAHAGGYGPASGTNAYVAKIDNFYGQGKPRYFYTQEEWNAYQRNAKGASQAGADRASKETATGVRQNQINNAQKRTAENQRLESQRKNAEAAQNAGADRSEKETGMDVTRQKQVADAKKAIAKREAEAKAKEQSANQAGSARQGESEGKGYAEYQKQQAEKKKQEMHEAAKKTITDRDAAIKAGQKSEQDRQKFEETKKNQKEAEASGNNRTQSDTTYNGEDLANALKRNTSKDKIDKLGTELGGILTEYYKVIDDNDDSDEGSKAKRKAWDEYFDKRDKIFEKYGIEFNSPEYAEAQKVVDEIEAEYGKSRNLKGKNLNFKHSALDELNDFKARVALGKEKNRLAHSRMISLTELQHAASSRYGAASGTNKYYAKLDDFYGKGQPRYFYSKDEWDAYQRNAKGASQAGADRAQKEKAIGVRQNQINDAQKRIAERENYEKNEQAAQGRAREQQAQSYTVKKALEENRRKNEGYAQNAEKDRWANANSDTSTKPSEAVKDNKVENDTKKDDLFKKEHTDYVQKNGDRIINEYNKAAEDEHNVSLQIDEKYGFNKAKTDEELNKCWDNLVQDMYQTALTIDNPDHCYMNFFWHDENGNGSAGWDISIPEFEQWAQEYQKEIDKVFEQGMNANSFDEKKAYGDQWEAMNEELRARSMEAKTKTLQMVTKLKKECLNK